MKYKIAVICPKGDINDYAFSDNFEKVILSYNRSLISTEPENFFHDFLSDNMELIKNSQGILISYHSTWQEAIMIILHLRLTLEWGIKKQPIIWDSEEEYTKIVLESSISGFNKSFIPTKTTQHFDRNGLAEELNINSEIEESFLKADKSNERISLEQISVKSLSSGHQITNEWGAYKLAQTAGFNTLLSKIEQVQPRSKTIYFKYLKYKYPIGTNAINTEGVPSSNSASAKYLLIDDNYDKGWKLVFSEVLKRVNLGLDAFEEIKAINHENEVNLIDKIKIAINQVKYQGILLDLRLNESDDATGKSNTNITGFTGGRILVELKKVFPFLPIIMVTASNKAWNMRQLLDGGADGYFIKEDPESNPHEDISKSTYKAFVQLIKDSQKKHETLAPFWKYIDEIEKNGTLIREKTENNLPTKVEERIKERLKMFFGLLKRSFEDSKYNKQFHYSDKALAFMTLWSCLNDIQLIHYDKNIDGTIKVNTSLSTHFMIHNDYQYLRYKEGNKFKTKIKEDKNSTPKTFSMSSEHEDGNKIEEKIGQQIAFLIYGFCSLDISFSKRNLLLSKLFELKNKRNHIYFTHGDMSSIRQLEEDNTEITIADCAQIFEIVYFLLKGIHIQINI